MSLEVALANHGVSDEDIEKGLAYQSKAGGALEKILLNMGSFSEELLPSVYSEYLQSPVLTEEQRDAWAPAEGESNLPDTFLLDNGWILLEVLRSPSESRPYVFVTKSPLNWDVLQYLNNENIEFSCVIASESDFDILSLKIADANGSGETSENLLSDIEEDWLARRQRSIYSIHLLPERCG